MYVIAYAYYVGHDDVAVKRAMREGFMAPSLFLFPIFP